MNHYSFYVKLPKYIKTCLFWTLDQTCMGQTHVSFPLSQKVQLFFSIVNFGWRFYPMTILQRQLNSEMCVVLSELTFSDAQANDMERWTLPGAPQEMRIPDLEVSH